MDFLTRILREKEKEVAMMPLEVLHPLRQTYSFYEYVQKHPQQMQVIGEVKRASPSKGAINLQVDVVAQATSYQEAGVAAISVLTDPYFFKGSIEDLRAVAENVTIPVLCKDFIIDSKQLIRARNAGATIVLLIVAALETKQLTTLYEEAIGLGLEVLVEVHNQQELAIAHALTACLIGVNNRNLKTFEVSLETSRKLGDHQEPTVVYISESGFTGAQQVASICDKYQGILVGESLMREGRPMEKVSELQVYR